MVKLKVNVKTKNDSIPSDTTKRKMPIVVDPKLHPHPRYHDTNVGDIRFRIKTTKKDVVLIQREYLDTIFTSNSAFLTICYTNIAVILVILFLGVQQFIRTLK